MYLKCIFYSLSVRASKSLFYHCGVKRGSAPACLPASRIPFQHTSFQGLLLTLYFLHCAPTRDACVSPQRAREAANQGVCVLYISTHTHMHTLQIHKPLCNYAANGMKWNLFTNSGGRASSLLYQLSHYA
jgi:hypothetical protein